MVFQIHGISVYYHCYVRLKQLYLLPLVIKKAKHPKIMYLCKKVSN